jgi:hypothetical protein
MGGLQGIGEQPGIFHLFKHLELAGAADLALWHCLAMDT